MQDSGVTVTIAIPASVKTDLRRKALDHKEGDSVDNKGMAPDYAARCIVTASDLRLREIYLPWHYKLVVLVYQIFPGLIDYFASRKYKT